MPAPQPVTLRVPALTLLKQPDPVGGVPCGIVAAGSTPPHSSRWGTAPPTPPPPPPPPPPPGFVQAAAASSATLMQATPSRRNRLMVPPQSMSLERRPGAEVPPARTRAVRGVRYADRSFAVGKERCQGTCDCTAKRASRDTVRDCRDGQRETMTYVLAVPARRSPGARR